MPGEHIEDRIAAEAANYIAAHKNKPFYMSYWAFSVHSPWQVKPALIEKYRGRIKPDSPQKNPLYAAMVESLDQAVGRLKNAVDTAALRDNTIFVFYSDNGGVHWPLAKPGLMVPEFAAIPPPATHPSAAARRRSTKAAPANRPSSSGPAAPSSAASAPNPCRASIFTPRCSP